MFTKKFAILTLIFVLTLFMVVSQVEPKPSVAYAGCDRLIQPLAHVQYLGYTSQNGIQTYPVTKENASILANITVCEATNTVTLGALQPQGFLADNTYIVTYASPLSNEYYMHVGWRIAIVTPSQWMLIKKLASVSFLPH